MVAPLTFDCVQRFSARDLPCSSKLYGGPREPVAKAAAHFYAVDKEREGGCRPTDVFTMFASLFETYHTAPSCKVALENLLQRQLPTPMPLTRSERGGDVIT